MLKLTVTSRILPQVTLMQSRAACLVAGEEKKGTLAEETGTAEGVMGAAAATGEVTDFVFLFFREEASGVVSTTADAFGGGAVCLPS